MQTIAVPTDGGRPKGVHTPSRPLRALKSSPTTQFAPIASLNLTQRRQTTFQIVGACCIPEDAEVQLCGHYSQYEGQTVIRLFHLDCPGCLLIAVGPDANCLLRTQNVQGLLGSLHAIGRLPCL